MNGSDRRNCRQDRGAALETHAISCCRGEAALDVFPDADKDVGADNDVGARRGLDRG